MKLKVIGLDPEAWSGRGVVELSRIAPAPDSLVAWARGALLEPGAAGAVVEPEDEAEATIAGWPALLFTAMATTGGARTLLVVIQLLEYTAAVRLRSPADAFEADRRQLMDALETATIDWEGEQALSLAEIWAGVDA